MESIPVYDDELIKLHNHYIYLLPSKFTDGRSTRAHGPLKPRTIPTLYVGHGNAQLRVYSKLNLFWKKLPWKHKDKFQETKTFKSSFMDLDSHCISWCSQIKSW